RTWTVKEIPEFVFARFQKKPCWFQIEIALALHEGKDVIGCVAMGAGKTLLF
ncbi:hypothetical protein BYT27DRAFT_7090522, partial [Phlegmacium glaucopus]